MFVENYGGPGSPIVIVNISNIPIAITLIHLRVVINVMRKETMEKLKLTGLRPTRTVLQSADRSSIKTKGMVEDIVVSIDSWEYPIDFMILNLGGYLLILGIT